MAGDMQPEIIKAEIRMRGSTVAALAAQHGFSKQTFSLALRVRISERADNIIANFLGMPPSSIWPSRYGRDGRRISMRRMSA